MCYFFGQPDEATPPDISITRYDGLQVTAATDGSGGPMLGPTTEYRRTAASATVIVNGKTALLLSSPTPGKQTVPRAEATGLILWLDFLEKAKARMDPEEWECLAARPVNIDASYIVKGVSFDDRHKLVQGSNGDLWDRLYQLYERNTSFNLSNNLVGNFNNSHETLNGFA